MSNLNSITDNSEIPIFKPFEKIARLNREMTITEKIDGTNAQIYVPEDPTKPIMAGSRSKWLGLGKGNDNHGFFTFVQANEAGFRKLEPGRYYGEWYGAGIQRGYGMTTKKLALFRPDVKIPDELTECVHLTTVLAKGIFSEEVINATLNLLRTSGSSTVPGYMKPEGIVVHMSASRSMYKVTLENDEAPKSVVQEVANG